MKLTKTQQAARDDHFRRHPTCWMCIFLGKKQRDRTELHHIAGRGKGRECRENYAAFCTTHHQAIQSQKDAELVCLALKRQYDTAYYSPETICNLRGRAASCWTDADVTLAERIMEMMRDCR